MAKTGKIFVAIIIVLLLLLGGVVGAVLLSNGNSGRTIQIKLEAGDSSSSYTIQSGGTLSQPQNPTEAGYYFNGWYTDTLHSKPFYFNQPLIADTTVYAWFVAYTYNINYYTLTEGNNWEQMQPNVNTDMGLVAGTVNSAAYNSNYAITKTIPVYTNYTFLGWSVAKVSPNDDYSQYGLLFTSANTAVKMGIPQNADPITGKLTVNYYAVFEGSSKSINFNFVQAANASGDAINASSYNTTAKYGTYYTLPVISGIQNINHDAYFLGYYINGGTDLKTAGMQIVVDGDITLDEVWNPVTAVLSFDTGLAPNTVTAPDAVSFTNGYTFSLPVLAGWEDYTFVGWSTTQQSADFSLPSGVVSGDYTMPNSSVTLYAVWAPTLYTITFDKNGGSGVTGGSTDANGNLTEAGTYGGTVAVPDGSIYTKNNYTFVGWSTNKDAKAGDASITGTYPVSGNETLYAIWQGVSVNIGYDLNGANFGDTTSESTLTDYFGSLTLNYGDALMLPSLTGLISGQTIYSADFTGYFAGVTVYNGGDSVYTGGEVAFDSLYIYNDKISGDLTLKLLLAFTPGTNSLVFDPNGGTISGLTAGYAVPNYVTGYKFALPVAPQRSGYTFESWNTNIDGSGSTFDPGADGMPGNIHTVYAIWLGNQITITLNSTQGWLAGDVGQNTNNTVDITENAGYALRVGGMYAIAQADFDAFALTNFVLDNFNTKADGSGTAYREGSTITLTGSITLYAIWAGAARTVQFDANNTGLLSPGTLTGNVSDINTTYTGIVTMPSGFSLTNYSFAGWNTQADGTGATYSAGQLVFAKDITGDNAGTVLYAMWKGKTVIINYNANGGSGQSLDSAVYGTDYAVCNTISSISAAFTRANYTLTGFNTSVDGNGTTYYPSAGYAGDAPTLSAVATPLNGVYEIVLYAMWQGNSVTIKYVDASGSNPDVNVTSAFGEFYKLGDLSGTDYSVNFADNFTRTNYLLADDGSGHFELSGNPSGMQPYYYTDINTINIDQQATSAMYNNASADEEGLYTITFYLVWVGVPVTVTFDTTALRVNGQPVTVAPITDRYRYGDAFTFSFDWLTQTDISGGLVTNAALSGALFGGFYFSNDTYTVYNYGATATITGTGTVNIAINWTGDGQVYVYLDLNGGKNVSGFAASFIEGDGEDITLPGADDVSMDYASFLCWVLVSPSVDGSQFAQSQSYFGDTYYNVPAGTYSFRAQWSYDEILVNFSPCLDSENPIYGDITGGPQIGLISTDRGSSTIILPGVGTDTAAGQVNFSSSYLIFAGWTYAGEGDYGVFPAGSAFSTAGLVPEYDSINGTYSYTFYACWTGKNVSVNYEYDGNIPINNYQTIGTYLYGDSLSMSSWSGSGMPLLSAQTGYTLVFSGWSLTPGGSVLDGSTQILHSNFAGVDFAGSSVVITLYALTNTLPITVNYSIPGTPGFSGSDILGTSYTLLSLGDMLSAAGTDANLQNYILAAYTLLYWTDGLNNYTAGSAITTAGTYNLTAVVQFNAANIKLNAGSGAGADITLQAAVSSAGSGSIQTFYIASAVVPDGSAYFTSSNRHFAGWNTSADGSGVKIDAGSTASFIVQYNISDGSISFSCSGVSVSSLTLYAQWAPDTFTITLNPNGAAGSNVIFGTVSYNQNSEQLAGTANVFSRPYYTFAGWNTMADGTGTLYTDGDTVLSVTSNIILYAKWAPVAIAINIDDGIGNTYTAGLDYGSTFTFNGKVLNQSSVSGLVKAGYALTGFTDSLGNTFSLDSDYILTTDGFSTINGTGLALLAVWAPNAADVVFMGGSLGGVQGTLQNGETTTYSITDATSQVYLVGDTYTLPANPFVLSGYAFAYWQYSLGGNIQVGQYLPGSTIPLLSGSMAFTAIWQGQPYTITYYGNGGLSSGVGFVTYTNSGNNDGVVIRNGQLATLATNMFTRTGYTFGTWNTSIDGSGTPYGAAGSISVSGNIVLYAQWNADDVTVTYNSNYPVGINRVSPGITYKFDDTITLADNTFSCDFYYFVGWSLTKTGPISGGVIPQDVAVLDAGSSYNISTTSVTFYAVWAPYKVTIIFDINANGGTGTMPQPVSEVGGTIILSGYPVDFYLADYTLTGWNTKADGTGTGYTSADNVILSVAFLGGPSLLGFDGAVINKAGDSVITLYAVWQFNATTLTLEANATNAVFNDSLLTTATARIYLNGTVILPGSGDMTNTGYALSGWWTTSDSSGVQLFTSNGELLPGTVSLGASTYIQDGVWAYHSTSLTLYAHWLANSYTIIFNANSGTVSPASVMVTYGNAVSSASIPIPIRTGYTFNGWFVSVGGDTGAGTSVFTSTGAVNTANTAYILGGKWNYVGGVTLYAAWQVNTVTINYYANDGSGSFIPYSTAYDQTVTLETNKVARTGYTYLGWCEDAQGNGNTYADGQTGVAVSSLTINWVGSAGTVALYAKWNANGVTLSYNANGGDGNMASYSAKYDEIINLTPNTFARTGYTFMGWGKTAGDSNAKVYDDKQQNIAVTTTNFDIAWDSNSTGTATLYAVWKADEVTINYYANGGDGSMSSTTIAYDQNVTLTKLADGIPGITRTYYTFAGWSKSATDPTVAYTDGQAGIAVSSLTISWDLSSNTGTVTLYAVWNADTVTIIYDANGGTGSMASTPTAYGQPVTLAANQFLRTGYTFAGWNGNNDGTGQAYTDRQNISVTTTNFDIHWDGSAYTITLYAVWTADAVTITYDANNVGGGTILRNTTYDLTITLETNSFTRTGYTFAKWGENNDGTGTTYTDGQTGVAVAGFTHITWTTTAGVTTGAVTLYAIWNADTVTIIYNPGQGGTGSMADTVTDYSVSVNLRPNTFTRTYYTFAGWDTAIAGTTVVYTDGQLVTVAGLAITWAGDVGTVTLYAVWTGDLVTISYDKSGGSGSMASTTTAYDKSVTLTKLADGIPGITNTGYSFAGWDTSSAGTNAVYTDGQSVTVAGLAISWSGNTGAVTLYAVWQMQVKIMLMIPGTNGSFTAYAYTASNPQIYLSTNQAPTTSVTAELYLIAQGGIFATTNFAGWYYYGTSTTADATSIVGTTPASDLSTYKPVFNSLSNANAANTTYFDANGNWIYGTYNTLYLCAMVYTNITLNTAANTTVSVGGSLASGTPSTISLYYGVMYKTSATGAGAAPPAITVNNMNNPPSFSVFMGWRVGTSPTAQTTTYAFMNPNSSDLTTYSSTTTTSYCYTQSYSNYISYTSSIWKWVYTQATTATFFALWYQSSYTWKITFDANLANLSVTNQTTSTITRQMSGAPTQTPNQGSSITLPTPTLTEKYGNYSTTAYFFGWAPGSTSTTIYTGTYTPTGDMTFYAVWVYEMHTINNATDFANFVVNGYYFMSNIVYNASSSPTTITTNLAVINNGVSGGTRSNSLSSSFTDNNRTYVQVASFSIASGVQVNSLAGKYYGNGKILTLNGTTPFVTVASTGRIDSLTVAGTTTTAGLAITNNGTIVGGIYGCTVSATVNAVNGSTYVSGFVGTNTGTIQTPIFNGTINSSTGAVATYACGIAGINSGTIDGGNTVGGRHSQTYIVNVTTYTSIGDDYNNVSGSIYQTANNNYYIAGIVGSNSGTIRNVYIYPSALSGASSSGGIFYSGSAGGIIMNNLIDRPTSTGYAIAYPFGVTGTFTSSSNNWTDQWMNGVWDGGYICMEEWWGPAVSNLVGHKDAK